VFERTRVIVCEVPQQSTIVIVAVTLDGFGVPLGQEHPQQQPAIIIDTG
jgi:hypothetical protein